MRSDIGFFLLWWTTGCEALDKRCTYLGGSAPAVLQKEERDSLKCAKVGPVNDRAALALRWHQTSTQQHGQMRRHRILRDVQQPGQFASRDAIGFVLRQEAETLPAAYVAQAQPEQKLHSRIPYIQNYGYTIFRQAKCQIPASPTCLMITAMSRG